MCFILFHIMHVCDWYSENVGDDSEDFITEIKRESFHESLLWILMLFLSYVLACHQRKKVA